MAESHWGCHHRSFALCIDLLMPPFEGLRDLPRDLVDCVLCFLMTVLMETHLIPNPHLNLFLSRLTVTHTQRGATRQHFPELLPHGYLVGTPAVSMVLRLLSFKTLGQVKWIHGLEMFYLLCFAKLMECRKWGGHCGILVQLLWGWRLVVFAMCINCHHI